MKIPKLINVFSDPVSHGIFEAIATVAGASIPWNASNETLDSDYIINHSSTKCISPLVKFYLAKDATETLTAARLLDLARICWNRYGVQWAKRYATLSLEYDPIENYSMTETETESGTNTGTVTESGTNSGTKTRTSESETTGEALGSVFAFDQPDPAIDTPSEKQTSENTTSGTESDTESGSRSETRTDNLAHSITRQHTRSGNIGVTTAQQMIESELKLWEYDFFETVYSDLDEILTIPIY